VFCGVVPDGTAAPSEQRCQSAALDRSDMTNRSG